MRLDKGDAARVVDLPVFGSGRNQVEEPFVIKMVWIPQLPVFWYGYHSGRSDGHGPYGSQILAIWAERGAFGGFMAKSTI